MTNQPSRNRVTINANTHNQLRYLEGRYSIPRQEIIEIALSLLSAKCRATDRALGYSGWLQNAWFKSDRSFDQVIVQDYLD